MNWRKGAALAAGAVMGSVAVVQLAYPPGTTFLYSNPSALLAAAVLGALAANVAADRFVPKQATWTASKAYAAGQGLIPTGRGRPSRPAAG